MSGRDLVDVVVLGHDRVDRVRRSRQGEGFAGEVIEVALQAARASRRRDGVPTSGNLAAHQGAVLLATISRGVDVEVLGVIRGEHLLGRLDRTEAAHAVEDLQAWPGERFGHRLLLPRAWELRDTVRGWDAMYVALAEALGAVRLTTVRRLAAAHGPTCTIELIDER